MYERIPRLPMAEETVTPERVRVRPACLVGIEVNSTQTFLNGHPTVVFLNRMSPEFDSYRRLSPLGSAETPYLR